MSGKYLWSEKDDGLYDASQEIEFPDYLIDEIIPEVGVGLFTGPSGGYKTFGALKLCISVAAERSFARWKVERKGASLYLAYEAGFTIDARIKAALMDVGSDSRSIPFAAPKNLRRFNEHGEVSPYDALRNSLREMSRIFWERYEAPLVFVAIDNAAAAGLIVDENNPAHWQAMMTELSDIAQEFELAIGVVVHAGKDASRGARGSSGGYAAADFEITFSAARDTISGHVTGRLMSLTKSREGETFPMAALSGVEHEVGMTKKGRQKKSLALRFDTSTEGISTALAEQSQHAAKGSKPKEEREKDAPERHALLVETVGRLGEGVSLGQVGQALVRTEYVKTLMEQGAREDAAQRSFSRSLKAMLDKEKIKRTTTSPYQLYIS